MGMDFKKLEINDYAKSYFSINWMMTNICNYKCSYCHPDIYGGKSSKLTFESVSSFLTKLNQDLQLQNKRLFLELTGGEITHLPWFGQIIELVHSLDGRLLIHTNLSKSKQWIYENLSKVFQVNASFHSEMTVPEDFLERLKIVDSFGHTGLHVNLMMLPKNFDSVFDLANRIKNETMASISLQPLRMGFGEVDEKGMYDYTDDQYKTMQSFRSDKNLLKNLSPSPRGGDKMRLTLNNDKIEYRSAYDLLVNRQTSFKGWSCNAGVSGVIIDEIGDVFRGWCKAGGVIGHISNFTIPTSPVICPASQCNCLVDVFSEKEKCFPGDQE